MPSFQRSLALKRHFQRRCACAPRHGNALSIVRVLMRLGECRTTSTADESKPSDQGYPTGSFSVHSKESSSREDGSRTFVLFASSIRRSLMRIFHRSIRRPSYFTATEDV